MKHTEGKEMSFLDHLEALRWHLVRSVIAIFLLAIVLFIYNEIVFGKIIFGPRHEDFITYRAFCKFSHWLGTDAFCFGKLSFELINTEISGQFMTHMWISFIGGLVIASPYVFWELWRFVKPALYENESKKTRGVVFSTSSLFILGVSFGYFLLVPLTINFLGNYQVSPEVANKITMGSYISIFSTMILATGIVFELPVIVYFLTKFGLITPAFMRKFRKHSVIVILILAAIITPSPDISSQLLVAVPLYVLYEFSIYVSVYVEKKEVRSQKSEVRSMG